MTPATAGRVWQSREFCEKADLALAAGGELTRLHDAYRAWTSGPGTELPGPSPARRPQALARVVLHWNDGTASTVYPPSFPVR